MNNKKIIKYHSLKNIFPRLIRKKVLVGGCFDLLHIGHLRFLKAAKKQGDILIIALESDDFIRITKKREPFHNQSERAEILSALEIVNMIILLPLFNSNDYQKLVDIIKPDVIAITKNDPQIKNKQKQAREIGAIVKIVTPHINNITSSRLVKKLAKFFF
jgi:cytidyltransferase-like protein